MATVHGTGGLAAWQMPLIHRIFRHELRTLERIVAEVPASADGRARRVANHLDFLLDGLNHHHCNEDDMVWPLLKGRAGPDAALVERMEQQHGEIDVRVADVRRSVDTWAADPGRASAAALVAVLGSLRSTLEMHLDEEEQVVVPLIDEHLTREEWEDMGRRGFEKFAPKERPIAMGQLLEVATPDEARRMFADLPLPIRVLWRVAGKRQYRRHVAGVRGKQLSPALQRAAGKANHLAVGLYRRSGGKIGGRAKGVPILLITVRGGRTGRERTVPVVYFDLDGGYLVCGSAGGMAREPQWFRNLRRADHAVVQIGSETHPVAVRVPESDERDRIWREVVLERAPIFAKYESKAARVIPVALLAPA